MACLNTAFCFANGLLSTANDLLFLAAELSFYVMSESFRPERPATPRSLVCRRCGGKLKIMAYLHSHVAIKRILDHPGLSPP